MPYVVEALNDDEVSVIDQWCVDTILLLGFSFVEGLCPGNVFLSSEIEFRVSRLSQ